MLKNIRPIRFIRAIRDKKTMTNQNIFLRENDQPSALRFSVMLVPKLLGLVVRSVLFLPLWPLFWLGWLLWGRPPNVPFCKQVLRYLKHAWTVSPENPELTLIGRFWLSLSILSVYLNGPLVGLAWLLDELLYARALNGMTVKAPLFVISAGRSGSTQITRYIEQDESLVAPNLLQTMFPYLWLWRLAPKTLGKFLTADKVRSMIASTMPKELWERHEADPFGADTFDGAFLSSHLNRFSLNFGPQVGRDDFNMAVAAPHDKELKEKVFVQFVDRIARKSLLYAGIGKRFYLKGHFLHAAEALHQFYADATFLTVIREPVSRLQSGINYMRVNPPDPVLGPVPWAWLTETLLHTETDYSKREQAWFTSESDAQRCVIKFTDFVHDLEGTLQKVYRECFDADVPAHLPKEHPPRERKHYTVNRSLEDLGVDEAKLKQDLQDYLDWCE